MYECENVVGVSEQVHLSREYKQRRERRRTLNAYQHLVSDIVAGLSYSDLHFESTFGTELIGGCYLPIVPRLNGNERPTLRVPSEEMRVFS